MRRVTQKQKKSQPTPSVDLLLLKRRIARWLPRHPKRVMIGTALSVLGLVALIAVGDLEGRHSRLGRAMLGVSADLGMSVRNVLVDGRSMTPPADILHVLDVARGTPILAIRPEEARNQLEALPWVRSATIERDLPDTLRIHLTEREPLALWQYHGKMALIDRDGVVVTTEDLGRFANLLLVVGENAPSHTVDLIALLDQEPDLMKRVSSAVWVGDRRWDVHLDNGIVVQLPETAPLAAWQRLARVETAENILGRNIDRIDMRLADRMVVRLIPDNTAQAAPATKGKHGKSGAKST
jgi:cell division protein FtsQ